MKKRKILGALFILIGTLFGILFYMKIALPDELGGYFSKAYYGQFGPLVISVELLIAGTYLFNGHSNTNFTIALFGCTALLDPLLNLSGLFTSLVPTYATVIFVICALISIWIAWTNAFNTGRISLPTFVLSFVLGVSVELFFNYL